MKNKELLKKIGICVIGIILICGVATFVFRDTRVTETPVEVETIELIAEDSVINNGLIPNEEKFNDIEFETETEEETVEEETIVEEVNDHLDGITVIEESTEEIVEETVEEQETNVAEREIIAMDKTMYAQKECNVRADAGTENEKVGSVGKNEELKVTGETKDKEGNTWYEIDLGNGEKGYVSGSLVGDSPVQESSVHNTTENTQAQSTSGVNNAATIPPTISTENQMQALFGSAYQGSGVGLSGSGGTVGACE